MVTVTAGNCCSQAAWRSTVWRAVSFRVELSTSKNTRSPTLTSRSVCVPAPCASSVPVPVPAPSSLLVPRPVVSVVPIPAPAAPAADPALSVRVSSEPLQAASRTNVAAMAT